MKNLVQTSHFESPVGWLELKCLEDELLELKFLGSQSIPNIAATTTFQKKVHLQLKNYFSGTLKNWDLKLKPTGTEFQKRSWQALTDIPYGETICYQEQAVQLGDAKKSRAVAMANSKNPIPIIIPCHRVIGKNKELRGYNGGVDKKIFLLELEGFKTTGLR